MPVLFTLVTKNNNKVDVYGKILPYSPSVLASFQSDLRSKVGTHNERTEVSDLYNCHGLTFIGKAGHLGSGTEGEWLLALPGQEGFIEYNCDPNIAQNDIETILKDSGMRLKSSVSNLKVDKFKVVDQIVPGDIVIYWNYESGRKYISHSGIIFKVNKKRNGDVNIKVLSKMGMDGGEYFHIIDNSFIIKTYGSNAEIWSDSKI